MNHEELPLVGSLAKVRGEVVDAGNGYAHIRDVAGDDRVRCVHDLLEPCRIGSQLAVTGRVDGAFTIRATRERHSR
jgi:hypothetical protein